MKVRGETALAAPKEQTFVKLSGKKTLARRISGECFLIDESHQRRNSNHVLRNLPVAGQRIPFQRGLSVLFLSRKVRKFSSMKKEEFTWLHCYEHRYSRHTKNTVEK